MALKILIASWMMIIATQSTANNQVYVCEHPNGRKEYRNTQADGCKPVHLHKLTVFPSGSSQHSKVTSSHHNNLLTSPVIAQREKETLLQTLENNLYSQNEKLDRLKIEYNNGQPQRQGNEKNYAKYLDRTKRLAEEIKELEKNIGEIKSRLANIN